MFFQRRNICQICYFRKPNIFFILKSLFVMIAWLSMAVDPTAIPGRISMVMMTLLTLMAMFSGVRQNTPKVRNYRKEGYTKNLSDDYYRTSYVKSHDQVKYIGLAQSKTNIIPK